MYFKMQLLRADGVRDDLYLVRAPDANAADNIAKGLIAASATGAIEYLKASLADSDVNETIVKLDPAGDTLILGVEITSYDADFSKIDWSAAL